jgi:hypothetical protein
VSADREEREGEKLRRGGDWRGREEEEEDGR